VVYFEHLDNDIIADPMCSSCSQVCMQRRTYKPINYIAIHVSSKTNYIIVVYLG